MIRRWWLFPLLLIIAIHIGVVIKGVTPVMNGEMPDTDTYMWLVRIENFINGQNWFDSTIARMNTPYGMPLHWTHPLDMLIIAIAWPVHTLTSLSWKEAIFGAGAVLPVFLHLLFAVFLGWMVRPLVRKDTLILIAFYAAIQPVIVSYDMLGRPDHQTLLLLAGVGLLGTLLRALEPRLSQATKDKSALMAGVFAGFGLWVSSEFEVTFVLIITAQALLWLLLGRKDALRALALMSGPFLLTTFAALLFERGSAWHVSRELDKISILQLWAVVANALVWIPLYVAEQKRTISATGSARLLSLLSAGTLGLVVVAFMAPELFRGPSGDMDPRIVETFALKTQEMQSLWPTTFDKATSCALWAGSSLFGLFLWPMLKLRRGLDPRWLLILLPAYSYTVLGLMHARFMQFSVPLGALLLVDASIYLKQRFETKVSQHGGALVLASLLMAPLMLYFFMETSKPSYQNAATNTTNDDDPRACSVKAITPTLLSLPTSRLLAHMNYGPELLYTTPHSVVAGPYHRDTDGILDSYVLADGPENNLKKIVLKRGISYLLLCDEIKPEDNGAFARALMDGHGPTWLTPLPVSATAERWHLFKVNLPSEAR